MTTWKIGDRVRSKYLVDRKKRRGVVEKKDGAYIYVRMNYTGELFQFYPNELERYR